MSETPPPPADVHELAHELVKLAQKEDQLKAMLEEVRKKGAGIREILAELFVDNAIQSIKLDNGLVFVSRRSIPKLRTLDGETPREAELRVAKMLHDAGLTTFISEKVNVKAIVADLEEHHDPELANLIETLEIPEIRVRRN